MERLIILLKSIGCLITAIISAVYFKLAAAFIPVLFFILYLIKFLRYYKNHAHTFYKDDKKQSYTEKYLI